MTLAVSDILDALESHALASGQFERVNMHEPKKAPGNGLTCAVWVQDVTPVVGVSGLASTAVRIEFNVRVYTPMLMEPQDAIDPAVLRAVDTLMEAYNGDFTLGGVVHTVDLLGAHGARIRAQAGYIKQDDKLLRVMTILLPVIVADVWEQVA